MDIFKGYFEKFTKEEYYSKEEVKYRISKSDSLEEVWKYIMKNRKENSTETNFKNQQGNNFFYYHLESLIKEIVELETRSKLDFIESATKQIKSKVMLDYLIEEALNSSAIEGAFSTKKETEELIKSRRTPTNKNEKMIFNNYKALEFINSRSEKEITEEVVIELFKIITNGTLEEEDQSDTYRSSSVQVVDSKYSVIYRAPGHEKVKGLMEELIKYINSDTSENVFIKASIIHFYFVYIHPFSDGNGRTARALTYMYLINSGYEFFKFFSISLVIHEQRTGYYKAIKKCEEEESDLTYFIKFNIKMMLDAIDETIERYGKEYLKLEIEKYMKKNQISFPEKLDTELKKYLRRKDKHLTVKKYMRTTNLSEATAKKHLNSLVKTGVFKKEKLDKEYIYMVKELDYFLEKNNK